MPHKIPAKPVKAKPRAKPVKSKPKAKPLTASPGFSFFNKYYRGPGFTREPPRNRKLKIIRGKKTPTKKKGIKKNY